MTELVILIVLIGLAVWIVKRSAKKVATTSADREDENQSLSRQSPSESAETCTSVGLFCAPLEAYGVERLQKAYWQVMRELQGLSESVDLLQAVMPEFLNALGDNKHAGCLLADTLMGIDWDWPKWHAFAKRQGYNTVPDVIEMVERQDLHAQLHRLLKADLVTLASSLSMVLPMSLKKTEMIKRLMTIEASHLESWSINAKNELLAKELQKLHRDMGRFLAGRISYIANQEIHYEQCSDPGYVSLHPYWRFICPNDIPTPAPKRCREMDQKVLPAAQAMQKFPMIPCDRLDCQCRFTTQRRVDEIAY